MILLCHRRNLRLAAVRRLAYEAADCGLLSPDLVAGIRRVRGARRLGNVRPRKRAGIQANLILVASGKLVPCRQGRTYFPEAVSWDFGGIGWHYEPRARRRRFRDYDGGMLRCLLVILGGSAIAFMPVWAQDCSGPGPTKRRVLKYYQAIFIGTVIPSNKASQTRFQVTDQLAGKLGRYVYVYPTASRDFETDKQYLVFASRCPWESGKGCLTSLPCDDTRPLERASALLKQLRAERSGKPRASVFGMLLYQQEDQWRPLLNTVVRLHNGRRSFEARTDEQGAYSFEQLGGGNYRVSADLPPNMEIAGLLGSPPEPFDLPSHTSLEHDILVFPTGRIAGTVIGPGDKPLHATSVSLYRADYYQQGKAGVYGYQGPHGPHEENWRPFEFDHLPAGDYILVFNYADFVERDAPFHRTFYPHAAKVEDAQIIHLAAGQQITNADIHVGEAAALREITVRVAWSGKGPTGWVPVRIVAEGPGTRTWLAEPKKTIPLSTNWHCGRVCTTRFRRQPRAERAGRKRGRIQSL